MTKPTTTIQSNPQPQPTTPNPTSHPFFKTAYGHKPASRLQFVEPSRTKQSFAAECDINNIMRRFAATGELTHLGQRAPMYGEVPDLDFQSAMSVVIDARNRFQALPSEIRDRFGNDPGALLAFLQDPENREEGIKLGLLAKPVESPTPPTPEAPPKGKDQSAT